MEQRTEQMAEMQEVAKERRRNVMRSARAKASKPSSSSSESGEREQKKEKDSVEKPEELKEQMPKESKEQMPKESEEQMPKESEEQMSKDLEYEGDKPIEDLVAEMSMADAVKSVKSVFRVDDNCVGALLEDEKVDAVRQVLIELERPIQEWPEALGVKLQKMAEEFKWSSELEDVVHKTYDEIEGNNYELEAAKNK